MNDRELLEMAAKANGVHEDQSPPTNGPGLHRSYMGNLSWLQDDGNFRPWNPLTNDGDALRLGVKLNMSVSMGPVQVSANTIAGALRDAFFHESRITQDPCAATRRVIVLAAAEVGRAV